MRSGCNMPRVDLHPEELIDAWIAGAVAPGERARLEDHLHTCASCSSELEVVRHLRSLKVDDAVSEVMVANVLRELSAKPSAPQARGWSTAQRVAAVALAVFCSGSLAAASWIAFTPTSEPIEASARPHRRTSARKTFPTPRPTTLAPSIVESRPSIIEPRPTTIDDRRAKIDRRSATVEARPPRIDHATPAPPALSPAELFSLGSVASRAGRYEDALRLFAQLRAEHPGTRPAVTSLVLSGDILLHRRGAHDEARRAFEDYLSRAPRGVLAAEARFERALALHRAGRSAEANAAWREIVQLHPDSSYSRRAQRELTDP